MSKNRGRRYSEEPKLNIKKVFAVIIAFLVIIMCVVGGRKILTGEKGTKISNDMFFSVYENNKYGVINSKGEKIVEPSYSELVVIPNQNKDVFIITYDVDYTNGTFKTKALNSKNEEIFTNYEGVEALENFDDNNNVKYNENVLKVKNNGKYGLITISGKEILPCEYEEISILKGNENSILIKQNSKVGLVDNNGKKIIEPKYKEIKKLSDDYKNGYIFLDENDKYGIIDSANNIILQNTYSEIKSIYDNGMYVVKGTDGYNVIDKSGNIITKKEYSDIKDIKNNSIIVIENNKYGVIKTSGEQILDCIYDDVDIINTEAYIVKNDNTYGIVNNNKENILEIKYQYINYISDADIIEASEDGITSTLLNNKFETKLNGILSEVNTEKGYIKVRIENEYKYYNFKFEEKSGKELFTNNTIFLSKKDGKYGYTDKNGNLIVDYIYDDATEQNNCGYAAVSKNGKWGSIDKNGSIVAPIENDLNNNTIIDFIGNWYIMRDVNLNCYTK